MFKFKRKVRVKSFIVAFEGFNELLTAFLFKKQVMHMQSNFISKHLRIYTFIMNLSWKLYHVSAKPLMCVFRSRAYVHDYEGAPSRRVSSSIARKHSRLIFDFLIFIFPGLKA